MARVSSSSCSLPEGEPLGLPLVHEERVLDSVGEVGVERLGEVIAEDGTEHGNYSQPEVWT